MTTALALLLHVSAASALVLGAHAPARPSHAAAFPAAFVRTPVVNMGLMDFLTGVLYDRQIATSKSRRGTEGAAGGTAASRLKVVLAHDRTGLDETTLRKIRDEIQQVVAK